MQTAAVLAVLTALSALSGNTTENIMSQLDSSAADVTVRTVTVTSGFYAYLPEYEEAVREQAETLAFIEDRTPLIAFSADLARTARREAARRHDPRLEEAAETYLKTARRALAETDSIDACGILDTLAAEIEGIRARNTSGTLAAVRYRCTEDCTGGAYRYCLFLCREDGSATRHSGHGLEKAVREAFPETRLYTNR